MILKPLVLGGITLLSLCGFSGEGSCVQREDGCAPEESRVGSSDVAHRTGDPIVESDGQGGYDLEIDGKKLKIEACWVSPDWGVSLIRDALKVSVSNAVVHVLVKAVQGQGQKVNANHPMFVRLSGNASADPQGRLMLGDRTQTFATDGWGWGDRLQLEPFATEVRLSSPLSMNFIPAKNGDWSVRLYVGRQPETDGRLKFEGMFDLARATFKLTLPSDIIDQKRVQYGRVLMPPQEKGFDPSLWRKVLEDPGATSETMGRIEDLLDARSRLYSAAERLAYKPGRDAADDRLVFEGYTALNAMDLTAAVKACEQIEARLDGSEAWMPYGAFNPFDWVKCFTQWGYMRTPDGCSVAEPNPWLLLWEDGFRFNLAQDERVVIARAKGEERFYETRYLKPMSDVSFERSWVSTSWNLPDRRVTFSVLTPIVDVEGIDTLTLSGFTSEPRLLSCPTDCGQMKCVRLVEGAPCAAEIVPSVLMDFTAPPPIPSSYSRGEQVIDASHLIGPYLRLDGADWAIALFPTAQPVSVKWEKGVLMLRFDRKGSVGVMRLRNNLQMTEQSAICEFFARTYLAYPISCRSEVENETVRWRYAYRHRTNSWNTPGLEMAPLPPLLSFAGFHVAGERHVKYPTKWGIYSAVVGDTVTCELPADLPREPRLRGVNLSLHDSDEVWESHIKDGVNWVRVYFSACLDVPSQCQILEDKLKKFGSRVRFLIDPHGCAYQVSWGQGMDPNATHRFCTLWENVSQVGACYPHVIEGYDLYNEPGLVTGGEMCWKALNEQAAAIIRRNHPTAKVYFSAINGGNPNGLMNLAPLDDASEPQTITYHFYSPHAFTHQKCATQNRGGDTCVYYPAWSAPIDWSAGHHFGGTTVDWYDRWTLAAILLPAYEHYAEFRKPLHVGEFGVIGYANGKSPHSAFLWTRDAVELFESQGASWHLWNGGFGLGNTYVRDWIYGLWRKSLRF